MAEATSQTLVCSVLCIEIVDYSTHATAEQLLQNQQLKTALGGAIAGIAVKDRMVLEFLGETAVAFLGDPEEALLSAFLVRGALAAPTKTDGSRLSVRFGINLGPIRLMKGIEGQLNVVGDGLVVARTIMKFAKSSQILVSRSFHEAGMPAFETFANLFGNQGIRIDQDHREHEVYAAPSVGSDSIRPILESGVALRRHGTGAGWPTAASTWFRNLFR
jgi:class 3 adenylate cyclase